MTETIGITGNNLDISTMVSMPIFPFYIIGGIISVKKEAEE